MLPVQRTPGSVGVITCMDPRVNLEAIGIPQFGLNGESDSPIRVVRTIGAMPEARSLIIGTFLAGIREFVVLMHTDCGCCLAFSKVDTIIENLKRRLSPSKFERFHADIGDPFRENLIKWLKAFEDPRQAVREEIDNLRTLSFVPDDVVFHGLLYNLDSGKVEVVVNGYEDHINAARPSKFSPELRERAVPLVLDGRGEHASHWAAITSISSKIGCTRETLRRWVIQAERNACKRPGLTTNEREELTTPRCA